MAVRGSSRSTTGSGSQRLFGKASLVGNTVRAKIGGRVTALAIPSSEVTKLERAAGDAVTHRKLQAVPDYALEVEHVYGYTEGCQNVISTGKGSYCYTVSSLGILWDEESQNQRILQGHTAEITAIAYSSFSQMIATGQRFVGNKSSGIRLWSMDQGQVKEKSQIQGHTQSVQLGLEHETNVSMQGSD